MSTAAEQWWQSVINEPWSFQKPTYYLGLGNWTVTNMLAAGAHERTPSKIQLLLNGATGFYNAGESMCFKLKVRTPGHGQTCSRHCSTHPLLWQHANALCSVPECQISRTTTSKRHQLQAKCVCSKSSLLQVQATFCMEM